MLCALLIVGSLEITEISFFDSREEAVQEAIYRAENLYHQNFTTFEQIQDYEENLYEAGGTDEVMQIECKEE